MDFVHLYRAELAARSTGPFLFWLQHLVQLMPVSGLVTVPAVAIIYVANIPSLETWAVLSTGLITWLCLQVFAQALLAITALLWWLGVKSADNLFAKLQVLAGLYLGLVQLGAGFFIPFDRCKVYLRWTFLVDPFYYAYAAIMRITLENRTSRPNGETSSYLSINDASHYLTGDSVLRLYGYEGVNTARHVTILLGMWVVHSLVALGFLWLDARGADVQYMFAVFGRRRTTAQPTVRHNSCRSRDARAICEQELAGNFGLSVNLTGLPATAVPDETFSSARVDLAVAKLAREACQAMMNDMPLIFVPSRGL